MFVHSISYEIIIITTFSIQFVFQIKTNWRDKGPTFLIVLPCFDLSKESKKVTNIGAHLRWIHDLDEEHGKFWHFVTNFKVAYPPDHGRIKIWAQQQK